MAAALEVGREEGGEAGLGHLRPDQPRAHRDGVGIVVSARQRGGERLADQCAAAGRIAVGRDRDADAGAAQRHAAFGAAVRQRGGDGVAVIGIIDARAAVGAEVEHVMAALAQPFGEHGLQLDGGVVGRNGDAHRRRFPERR